MKPIRCCLLAGAVLPTAVVAAPLSEVLGPITPVYQGNSDGTYFSKSGWFPDAQFPLVWGGDNEPNTSLSWWMERRSGSMRLDYVLKDGVWPASGPANSPDERGYWIQSVYRPVDIKPSLRGTTVVLDIFADNAQHGATPSPVSHVIDDNYLVGFAHTEDWNGITQKVDNYSRTIYSFDNGKTWRKGPTKGLGVMTIDNHTTPGTPRLITIWQYYQGPGKKTWTTDIAKGVDNYQVEDNAFSHGNLYGVTGIVWSRYLNRWIMMFGYNGGHGKVLNFKTTQSFDTYSPDTSSIGIEKNEVPGNGVVAGGGDYPTLLGGHPVAARYPIPFNMEMGQLGWIYNKANGGLSGRAIHFIEPVEKQITWQGGDASRSLAATIVDAPLAARSGIFLGKKEVSALGDEDKDGIPNLIEDVTGSRLDAADTKPPGDASFDDGHAHFTYTRDITKRDLCKVEWSETLTGDWRTDGISETVLSTVDGIETVRASLPRTVSERCFMRLRVTADVAQASRSVKSIPAAPIDLGGGISLSVDQTEIPNTNGSSAAWTFTRDGATTGDLVVSFGITGSAALTDDYTVVGAASLAAGVGTIVIPDGQSSATLTTAMTGGADAGRTIVLSKPQALQLAAIANWSQGTETFTGIADEVHTLNFNSPAGGEFENDIPVSKRVRSIYFGAGSGDHTINGNPFGVEAATRSLTNGNGFYGITQFSSAATATFNTDIHARSAALYLRSAYAGGKIELNGTVDMLGTGGVVISGQGDVAINGDLIDSGYSDFGTGQPEFVASVNPGRLIMVGEGILSLAGNNTFAGRTEIKQGIVQVDSYGALQNSVVTLRKDLGLAPSTDFKLGGLDGLGDLYLAGNQLTLGNHNPPNCYPTSHTGTISGSGSITKIDTNTQRIGAFNTHSGGTVLKGGVLVVPASTNSAFGSGSVTLDGGTLKAGGALSFDNAVQVGSSGGTIETNGAPVTLDGPLSGGGYLYATGNGTLVLNDGGTFSGTLRSWSALRTNHANALGNGALELGGRLILGADQTLAGLTTIAASTAVDTGPHTLTVDGPIGVGAGKSFAKAGTGTLAWSGDSSLLFGDLILQGGTLSRSQQGDLTRGNVTIGGARVVFSPQATTGDAVIRIAREEGKKLTLNGTATLVLDKGSADSLAVNIGSTENSNALEMGESSTALVALGAGTKLFAYGQEPTPTGEIFSPAFVLAGADAKGSFAVYSAANGFTPFQGYTPQSSSFSVTTDGSEFSNLTAAGTLSANGTVRGLRIDGSHTLTLTGKTLTFAGVDEKAGILLNSGSLSGGTIAFGGNKGYIYVSGPGSTIGSVISGSGGLVFSGPQGSKVTLNGSSTSYSTRLTVAGTTLVLPNTAVMGAGYTPITLDGGGTLSFPYNLTAGRSITFGTGGAAIHVASGATFTNNGDITGSGEFRKTGPGTLKWGAGGDATGPVFVEQGMLDYSASSINGTLGPINIANGARVNLSTTHAVYFDHEFFIAGSGPSDMGALSISGSGKTKRSVMLTGNARIRANSGATFAFEKESAFDGGGYDLEFSGSGRFGIHGAISLGTGDLGVVETPYLSIKETAALTCGDLTSSAGSTLELNTQNVRITSANIGGVLDGKKGRIISDAPVVIANGGTIAGGWLTEPDLFTIEGDLTLSSTATTHTYVKGAIGASSDGTGSKHSQILVTGSGAIGGTLKLVIDPSYTPATGDEIFVMLRNGGSGSFSSVVVVEGTTTHPDQDALQGNPITIKGKTGTIRYNSHSSINLSNPSSASDISIKF